MLEKHATPQRAPQRRVRPTLRALSLGAALLLLVVYPTPGLAAVPGRELSAADKQALDESFALCMSKPKGPFDRNHCACADGRKERITNGPAPCAGSKILVCAAWRMPWAEALMEQRLYLGNVLSRDLHDWKKFSNHHDLVRGFILEKYFIDTHPRHKFAQLRQKRGIAGSEDEARDAPRFFERYLDSDEFREPRHYLLAYELQRRFFVRDDQGRIGRARDLASAIHEAHEPFKPLRDAVHNQINAALLPQLRAYRPKLPDAETLQQLDRLIAQVEKLTALDEKALQAQLKEIASEPTRSGLLALLDADADEPLARIRGLANLMRAARRNVEGKRGSAADRRRQIDAAITAATLLQQRADRLLATEPPPSIPQQVELLRALADGAYGAGLLAERERAAALANLDSLRGVASLDAAAQDRAIQAAERVAEWAQTGVLYAFAEVRPAWTHVLPDTQLLGDDILRGSPVLVYARALQQLESRIPGREPGQHELFGEVVRSDVRALNPGLAFGTLRVSPAPGEYERDQIVALADTPPDLSPAAGILTQGEGNVVSHVQLLARALGIPNVVLGPSVFQRFAAHDGKQLLLVVTPGGRVVAKLAAQLTQQDRAALAEFRRNERRSGDGTLSNGAGKLRIDVDRLDLSARTAIDLAGLGRDDSGVRVGPKAAYLGTLKQMFPDKVARGVVVPFGAYYDHYRRAKVAVPEARAGMAEPGSPLPDFVEATYATFFGELMPQGDEKALAEWIRPRLEIMRHSIVSAPLSDALRRSIRGELQRQDLLSGAGLFVRSDTNVEDLEDFNGAGLNLTLFNLMGEEEVLAGLKKVWASPFSYRSFSWRQTLIDQPLWVLPSVVILESVPSEKSGVLVTADIQDPDADAMLVATSEGVGGAVDGTPAETLVWSPQGVELLAMFKSPHRRMLDAKGGSRIVASTGREEVLSPGEIDRLVATARTIQRELAPTRDGTGRERPWDIEFGFADDRLWLFQVRPFIGNEELDNIPALAIYETAAP